MYWSSKLRTLTGVLAALLAGAVQAGAIAQFDASSAQLTLPTVRVDGAVVVGPVVLRLGALGTLAAEDPAVGTEIEYRSAAQQLLLPSVVVGSTTFNRISLTGAAFELVSVGALLTPSSAGACQVDAEVSYGASRSTQQVCLANLPGGASCSAGGAQKYADNYFLAAGYTYTARYTPVASCSGFAKIWDLGADLGGAWRKVTPTLINSGTNMNGIAVDHSRFYAVASRYVLTSSDGVNWTQASTPSSGIGTLESVAWSGSAYVAVGATATLLFSTDGQSWRKIAAPSGASARLTRVIWANGRFVAVGGNQHVLTSPDGQTWTLHATPGVRSTIGTLVDVAWSGSVFLAIGYDMQGSYALRSTDGVNWAVQALPADITVSALHYAQGIWYLAGASSTSPTTPFIRYSADAQSWSTKTLNTLHPVGRFADHGTRVLAVAGSALWSSADAGANWVDLHHGTSQGYSLTNGVDVACLPNQCVIVGDFGTVFSTF